MDNSEVISRTDIGEGLEIVTRRVYNKWEPEVYQELMKHKGESTFYSRLCNQVAQLRYERIHGEGSFAKLSYTERYKAYQEAGEFVDAVRDLGHLLN